MRDRSFGVEIECGYDGASPEEPECVCEYDEETGEYVDDGPHCEACCGCWYDEESNPGCEVAAELLHSNGFRAWTDDIHADGSGVEIPSPILHGYEGLNELRQVMKLLSDNGFYTGYDDGLHVHHDAPEFTEDESLVARLVELWEENLPLIDKFVAGHRRGGEYWACNSYSKMSEYRYTPDFLKWEEFKRTKSLENLSRDKFRSLNITPLSYQGTVEFRLHEGTLDFNQAYAWILFGQSLLETAKRRKTVVTCASAVDLLRLTRTSPKATRTLLTKAAA